MSNKFVDNVSDNTAEKFACPKFYQVLDKLDFLMRKWAGETLGDDGVYELMSLCWLIYSCEGMWYHMPKEAKSFFKILIDPKHAYDHSFGCGGMYRNYAQLRQYLIDNQAEFTKLLTKEEENDD